MTLLFTLVTNQIIDLEYEAEANISTCQCCPCDHNRRRSRRDVIIVTSSL